MVAHFLCVGELLRARGLVHDGSPRGRFCFRQSSRMSSLVVSALSCDLRNNSEVRRVLTVFVPTVYPQTNSELDSRWLAHVTIHHQHMTDPTTTEWNTTPWMRSILLHDSAIKLSKTKVHVYSDSVLCLGKFHEHLYTEVERTNCMVHGF